jgi:hypothetical protein
MGSMTGTGSMTGSPMGWLAAGFLGLDSLLYQLRGPALLALLVATGGGLLAALVALGRGAFAARGGRRQALRALGLLALAPLCHAFARFALAVTGGGLGPPTPFWTGWLCLGLVLLPRLVAPAAATLGLVALIRVGPGPAPGR